MLAPEQQVAVLEGEHVQRHDGERVGVERDQQRDRQVLSERRGEQERRQHLQRPGDQPGEQADRHRARHRAPVEAPQARVLQPAAEAHHQAMRAHRLAVDEIFAEMVAHSGQPTGKERVDCR
jgi:hypothetical protein